MSEHSFILTPDNWIGEGKIKLNMIEEELHFFTKWEASHRNPQGRIECFQEIQIKGLSDVMHNQFFLFDILPNQFTIELENAAVGKVLGKGIITEKLIAWEFRLNHLGFEGFEFYEKQKDGHYLLHAEYATADQYRTVIHGKIWQHKEPPT